MSNQHVDETPQERRRRQNRESQQRWRARRKEMRSDSKDSKSRKSSTRREKQMDAPFLSPDAMQRALLDYRTSSSNQLILDNGWHTDFSLPDTYDEITVPAQHQDCMWSLELDDQTSTSTPEGVPSIRVLEHNMPPSLGARSETLSECDVQGSPVHWLDPRCEAQSGDESCISPGSSSASIKGWNRSPAEASIEEVQGLYSFGVRTGLLKPDDRVGEYLNTMRLKYQQLSQLGDMNNYFVQHDEVESVDARSDTSVRM
ncbi:hypothetical protein PT974_11174 [Cladobotryum mycophilum]|uniref:BZIP domain-containing protein n=1 Tax=Cladobotryum mycophilum TaxID=491253 RepID=A0ABR0S4F9_9HYPO